MLNIFKKSTGLLLIALALLTGCVNTKTSSLQERINQISENFSSKGAQTYVVDIASPDNYLLVKIFLQRAPKHMLLI